MAIRYVDVEPDDAARRRKAPAPKPAEGGTAEPDAPASDLPHAKPEPKPRGRKKPLR